MQVVETDGHLKPCIPGLDHIITNAWKFLESIKHVKKAPGKCTVSFDAVSLFTSVYLKLAREAIVNLLDVFYLSSPRTAATEMHEQPKWLLNYFQLGKRIAMGSPMSGLIVEAET